MHLLLNELFEFLHSSWLVCCISCLKDDMVCEICYYDEILSLFGLPITIRVTHNGKITSHGFVTSFGL